MTLAQSKVAGPSEPVGAQERLLRSVVDSLEARMCILGDDGVIVGTNRPWDELAVAMSWTPEQAGVGADFFALLQGIRGDLSRALAAAAREMLAGSTEQRSIKGYLPVAKRGEDVVVRMQPVTEHETARVVLAMIDITAAVRNQRELRRITDEAQLLALVAQHTDNAVVISDADGRIEWANHAFSRISGYPLEELVGLSRQDLMHGQFASTPAYGEFAEALGQGRSADLQIPGRTKDGSPYWTHMETAPIVEDGVPVRFVSVERDVTAQRAADRETQVAGRQTQALAAQLGAEKAVLRQALALVPQPVYFKDAAGRYTGVNRAYLALRGLAGESAVLGRTEAELGLGPADPVSAGLGALEAQVLATGLPVENHTLALDSERTLAVTVLPLTDDKGTMTGLLTVAI